MPHRLTDLEIDEVSLVDFPANTDARVVLFKRDDTQDELQEMPAIIEKALLLKSAHEFDRLPETEKLAIYYALSAMEAVAL